MHNANSEHIYIFDTNAIQYFQGKKSFFFTHFTMLQKIAKIVSAKLKQQKHEEKPLFKPQKKYISK